MKVSKMKSLASLARAIITIIEGKNENGSKDELHIQGGESDY